MATETLSPPRRTARIRRAASLLCRQMGWAPLHEVSLPNGRRADILALTPDGQFICIEIKSCASDFLSDHKWEEYRAFADALYFAVDVDFPRALLPEAVGLIITAEAEADLARTSPDHPMHPTRRRALLQQFAQLAATRLDSLAYPQDANPTRAE